MHRFLLHNDEIRDAGDRIVSPGQVGLLNGWGVFSTIRVCDGVLFAWERHWARMQRDAARLRVPFPENPEWLEHRLQRLIEANQAFNATLRVVVVRNRGGMWEGPAESREFDVIAFTADVNPWGEVVRLGMVPNARHAASEFAGVKYLSWSQNLTWYERAHEQGLDEVILLNERGEVSECTSANVFAVQGSHVWTPPLSAGCLPGITRAILLEEIRENGIEIGQKTLLPKDLEDADEVFISSTTRELMPVISIQGLKLRAGRSTTDRLQAAFTRYVQRYVAPRKRPVTVTVT
jgi:branched-chain amino acid aminotransferase